MCSLPMSRTALSYKSCLFSGVSAVHTYFQTLTNLFWSIFNIYFLKNLHKWFVMEPIISRYFLPLSEDLISRILDQCSKTCAKAIFTNKLSIILQILLWFAEMWFEYFNKFRWLVVIIVCLFTGPEMVKTQAKQISSFSSYPPIFGMLIPCIWNCNKT